jgi:hypothetical protein
MHIFSNILMSSIHARSGAGTGTVGNQFFVDYSDLHQYLYIHIYTHGYTCEYMYIFSNILILSIHARSGAGTCTVGYYFLSSIQTCTGTCLYTYIHTDIHVNIYIYIFPHCSVIYSSTHRYRYRCLVARIRLYTFIQALTGTGTGIL